MDRYPGHRHRPGRAPSGRRPALCALHRPASLGDGTRGFLRRRQPLRRKDPGSHPDGLDRVVDESPQFNIKEAFNKLPVKTQIALRMLYWKNKSRKEIAATLGISENGAKNVIQRGKKKIKEYLREVNE